MKEILIACHLMEAEIEKAMETTGSRAGVIWLDKQLHNDPDALRATLQANMDAAETLYCPERILLGFGFCGNAVLGLRAGNYRLVLPRIDDCVTMFIGSRRRKARLEGGVGTIFLTRDWTGTENDLASMRRKLVEDYGPEEAQELFDMMYGHYGRIGVLDTGCYPLRPVLEQSRAMAEELGFEHQVYEASNDYLCRLLTGPWDGERFIVKEPGEAITGRDLWIE